MLACFHISQSVSNSLTLRIHKFGTWFSSFEVVGLNNLDIHKQLKKILPQRKTTFKTAVQRRGCYTFLFNSHY